MITTRLKINNLELFPCENLELKNVVDEFLNYNPNIQLLYLEGFGNVLDRYMKEADPDKVPADVIIQSCTFGRNFLQKEVGDKWTNIADIMTNYLKMFCSRTIRSGPDELQFFIVYKKRVLIKPGRDIIYEEKSVDDLWNPHGVGPQ